MKIHPARLRSMSKDERRIHDDTELFFREVGELFLVWSDVEFQVYRVLIHYAGVTDEVGMALFSGARSRAMIDFMKNIFHNTEIEAHRVADLEYLFQQINTINTERDRLAHHGSTEFSIHLADLKRSLSNYRRVGKKGTGFHTNVSSESVERMADDLHRIHYRLSLHYRKGAPTKIGEDVPAYGPTWRHIPEQPNSPKNKTRQAPVSQKRQRKPSPE
jgi:hypothetical protein